MNIYGETNFFLEIVFSQEQSKFCEKIITLARKKKIKLIIPAYSFAEALYKLESQRKKRENFQRELNTQISQLAQTVRYNSQITNFRALDTFLTQNIEEEKKLFEKCRKSLTKNAEIISFSQPSIVKLLKNLNCKFFPDFENAYNYIKNANQE